MKKIIIGTRVKDGWGNEWYVVGKDAKGYNLHSCRFSSVEHFSHEEIKNNFKIKNLSIINEKLSKINFN